MGDLLDIIAVTSGITSLAIVIWKFGFSFGALSRKVDSLCTEIEHLKAQVAELKQMCDRVTVLETKMELFWKMVEQKVVNVLKSPHTPRFDELLDKFVVRTLTLEEALELKDILSANELEAVDSGKKIAMALVSARLEQLILDLKREERNDRNC